MMAWAKALDEQGESDKARYLAARLKEFRNDQTDEFFAPCQAISPAGLPGAATPASAGKPSFQCLAPTKELRFEDFR
jgi:hypothetical protein